jgi:hypothetical protein
LGFEAYKAAFEGLPRLDSPGQEPEQWIRAELLHETLQRVQRDGLGRMKIVERQDEG